MFWKKENLIAALERENADLRNEVRELRAAVASVNKSPDARKAEDEKPKRHPVTMLDWCRRQSSRSYQYATSKGKTPLVAGLPVGVVNPEEKRDGTA